MVANGAAMKTPTSSTRTPASGAPVAGRSVLPAFTSVAAGATSVPRRRASRIAVVWPSPIPCRALTRPRPGRDGALETTEPAATREPAPTTAPFSTAPMPQVDVRCATTARWPDRDALADGVREVRSECRRRLPSWPLLTVAEPDRRPSPRTTPNQTLAPAPTVHRADQSRPLGDEGRGRHSPVVVPAAVGRLTASPAPPGPAR